MARIKANGIEFEYDEIGPKEGEPIVLVMGFGAQMTKWPDAFRQGLADAGYRVIRFDNRDIGLSHQFDAAGMPDIPGIMQATAMGKDASAIPAYTLNDMAADVAALIEALGLGSAHVMGASMGGMIVQLLALNHPSSVRSLIPIMTTSSDPDLPQATPEALAALMTPPASLAREDVIAQGLKALIAIGSDASIRNSDDVLGEVVAKAYDRAYRPMGVMRQYAAILAQPRWHERLGDVKAPTLVLHGAVDPLIPPANGRDVAQRIAGAQIVELEKWGHDVPAVIIPEIVQAVTGFLAQVEYA